MDADEQALSAYRAQVEALQRAAGEFVERSMGEYLLANPGASALDLRDYGAQVLAQAYREFGEAGSKAACDLYDATSGRLGAEVDAAQAGGLPPEGSDDPEKIAQAKMAKVEAGDLSGFVAALASCASDRPLFQANRTVAENARRAEDAKEGMRFARVPTGRETCGFCVMLASRGFAYTTREDAGDAGARYNAFHYHCDCVVVPGNEGTRVEGYDPEWYRQVYEDAQRTCGSSDARDICREIETRAPQWVYRREPGRITRDENAEPRPKERRAAEWLAERGFDVHFRATRANEAKKTSDVFLGGSDGTAWEMKQPRGSGKWNISNQFNEAKGQSGRLILDVSESPWNLSDIEDEIIIQLSHREDFEEVLVLKDGYLKRFKK